MSTLQERKAEKAESVKGICKSILFLESEIEAKEESLLDAKAQLKELQRILDEELDVA